MLAEELRAQALNLRWTWDPRIRGAFEALSPELWEETRHNPVTMLARLGDDGIEEAAARRPGFAAVMDLMRIAAREHHERNPPFYDAGAPLLIGYFSLEFGITESLPIYSGGLGILAGDHLKATSDLNLPLVAIGLLYRQGFGRQKINEAGEQTEYYQENLPGDLAIRRVDHDGEPLEVEAPIGAEMVRIQIWRAQVGRVPLFLLDTDLESNPPHLRGITDRLYTTEPDRRLRQEIVLGIGGVRALRALGMEATVFHLNEGHSMLVGIERIRELRRSRQMSVEEARLVARAGIVFTTHTPIAAGSDYFDAGLVWDLLGPYLADTGITFDRFMDLGREKPGDPRGLLCSTYLALRMADHSVGVSRLHGAVSRRLWKDAWPGIRETQVPIGSVTNGVHMGTWVAPEIAALLARAVSLEWADLDAADPRWERIDEITASELWATHSELRRRLAAYVGARGDRIDPDVLTIAFSRRFTPYKRATLLLTDRARLERILDRAEGPVQFVFAGKAHPADMPGKALLEEVIGIARASTRVTFLEDYDIEVARHLVQGADVWLNNPRRFVEASGTSGMKAAANGVLNLSVLDGWWDEGYRPDAGWAIPSGATLDRPAIDDAAEAEALYRLLEREVVPAYYERDADGVPQRWVAMMRSSIRHLLPGFSARRMVLDYFNGAYAPAARRVQQLRLLPDWGG